MQTLYSLWYDISLHEKELCIQLVIYKDYPKAFFTFKMSYDSTLQA